MIFVTVGTHTQPFDRLIEAMDNFAATVSEPVVMQIGCATIEPQHARWFRFAPYDEMQRYSTEARLVVCQGATSILVALRQGATVVAVPRRRAFGEAIDDHQVEFVAKLAKHGFVIGVDEVRLLPEAIHKADAPNLASLGQLRHELVSYVEQWLDRVA